MFFSEDLLQLRGGLFSTIWRLGIEERRKTKGVGDCSGAKTGLLRKLKKSDLQNELGPVVRALLERLPCSHKQHLSLRLTTYLVLGTVRCHLWQAATLLKDVRLHRRSRPVKVVVDEERVSLLADGEGEAAAVDKVQLMEEAPAPDMNIGRLLECEEYEAEADEASLRQVHADQAVPSVMITMTEEREGNNGRLPGEEEEDTGFGPQEQEAGEPNMFAEEQPDMDVDHQDYPEHSPKHSSPPAEEEILEPDPMPPMTTESGELYGDVHEMQDPVNGTIRGDEPRPEPEPPQAPNRRRRGDQPREEAEVTQMEVDEEGASAAPRQVEMQSLDDSAPGELMPPPPPPAPEPQPSMSPLESLASSSSSSGRPKPAKRRKKSRPALDQDKTLHIKDMKENMEKNVAQVEEGLLALAQARRAGRVDDGAMSLMDGPAHQSLKKGFFRMGVVGEGTYDWPVQEEEEGEEDAVVPAAAEQEGEFFPDVQDDVQPLMDDNNNGEEQEEEQGAAQSMQPTEELRQDGSQLGHSDLQHSGNLTNVMERGGRSSLMEADANVDLDVDMDDPTLHTIAEHPAPPPLDVTPTSFRQEEEAEQQPFQPAATSPVRSVQSEESLAESFAASDILEEEQLRAYPLDDDRSFSLHELLATRRSKRAVALCFRLVLELEKRGVVTCRQEDGWGENVRVTVN